MSSSRAALNDERIEAGRDWRRDFDAQRRSRRDLLCEVAIFGGADSIDDSWPPITEHRLGADVKIWMTSFSSVAMLEKFALLENRSLQGADVNAHELVDEDALVIPLLFPTMTIGMVVIIFPFTVVGRFGPSARQRFAPGQPSGIVVE